MLGKVAEKAVLKLMDQAFAGEPPALDTDKLKALLHCLLRADPPCTFLSEDSDTRDQLENLDTLVRFAEMDDDAVGKALQKVLGHQQT